MILNYDQLWRPYAVDGNKLENTIRYLRSTAATFGIAPYLVDMAISEVFHRVASGEVFPKDKCPCGCGIDKAGTAITHVMRDAMFEMDKQNRLGEAQFIETKQNLETADRLIEGMEDASSALKTVNKKPGFFKRLIGRD